ncbi:fumarylacetoacetate hydrolase family protein [Caulobacter sp. ErkDOM-YI]|uniref:fumarylacetoacetate hydrolase family protein n=1 Tax=unclassified Caulobacter TaxID=2648921 RepID=UPI003AF46CBC
MTAPWFAIGTYDGGKGPRPAIVVDDMLFDLAAVQTAVGLDAGVASVDAALANWETTQPILAEIAARTAASGVPPLSVTPLAPFNPRRIFCTASNFVDHASEMKTALAAKVDSAPYIFLKSTESVVGADDEVVIPSHCTQIDWEVELGVVIGREGHRISVENARDHIAGYVVFNDVSARDQIARTDFPFKHDWFRSKSYDTFGPLGPWLVPDVCIPDPMNLSLKLSVNDVGMQDGSSAEMIFNIYEQIAYLSTFGKLRPGDLIATGTPAGVGKGRGIFLKPGDRMTASIELIGAISNPLVAEEV